MRRKRKLHDFVLKGITGVVEMVFALAVCCLDSVPNNIPVTICFVCLGYFALLLIANIELIWGKYIER